MRVGGGKDYLLKEITNCLRGSTDNIWLQRLRDCKKNIALAGKKFNFDLWLFSLVLFPSFPPVHRAGNLMGLFEGVYTSFNL